MRSERGASYVCVVELWYELWYIAIVMMQMGLRMCLQCGRSSDVDDDLKPSSLRSGRQRPCGALVSMPEVPAAQYSAVLYDSTDDTTSTAWLAKASTPARQHARPPLPCFILWTCTPRWQCLPKPSVGLPSTFHCCTRTYWSTVQCHPTSPVACSSSFKHRSWAAKTWRWPWMNE